MLQKQDSKYITVDGKPLQVFYFSGGEVQIFNGYRFANDVEVIFTDNKALIELLLLAGDLEHIKKLYIPYFPYARQDRLMNDDSVFSLKTICNLINTINYEELIIYDSHSDVAPALLKNVTNYSQKYFLEKIGEQYPKEIKTFECIISPDAGAVKKSFDCAKYLNIPQYTASKLRDTKTGNIICTKFYDDVKDKHCLIVDDICDGGMTFIELGKVLKYLGAAKVSLYVTHGIFSQGFDVFKGIIDTIYYTNSLKQCKTEDINYIRYPKANWETIYINKVELLTNKEL
jgi:ribose-phosphate pyrophosphokinase